MGKFTCGCLNVMIHTKSEEFIPVEIAALGIGVEVAESFFKLNLSEVQLNLEGVRFEHKCLVKSHLACGWMVFKCMNCETETHATHAVQGSGKVLVNSNLKGDPKSIDTLVKSRNYSQLYRIVLETKNDNHPIRTLGVQSGKYESLQKSLTKVQQQLNEFLIEEESAMEERIRRYEEKQRSAYAELQNKARREKNAMISLVLASEQDAVTTSLTDAMNESPPSPLSQDDEDGSMSPKVVQSGRRVTQSKRFEPQPSAKRTFQSLSERMEASKTYAKPPRLPRDDRRGNDADGDLDFESAFNDDSNRPFYNSDDELEDTDDSEPDVRSHKPKSIYSASVPISMPVWGSSTPVARRSLLEEEEMDEIPPQDPDDMAASIKALARSVHEDSREIFGDLPRRRTMAAEFKKL